MEDKQNFGNSETLSLDREIWVEIKSIIKSWGTKLLGGPYF